MITWEYLLNEKYINATYDEKSKQYAIKMANNDTAYLKENHRDITNYWIQHECWLIGVSCSNDPQFIEFLYEKFKINLDYQNSEGNNCLLMACRNNPHVNVIKYLIEGLKVNRSHRNKYENDCLIGAVTNN